MIRVSKKSVFAVVPVVKQAIGAGKEKNMTEKKNWCRGKSPGVKTMISRKSSSRKSSNRKSSKRTMLRKKGKKAGDLLGGKQNSSGGSECRRFHSRRRSWRVLSGESTGRGRNGLAPIIRRYCGRNAHCSCHSQYADSGTGDIASCLKRGRGIPGSFSVPR